MTEINSEVDDTEDPLGDEPLQPRAPMRHGNKRGAVGSDEAAFGSAWIPARSKNVTQTLQVTMSVLHTKMMKGMVFQTAKVAPLQQRLTQFHGTCVPILILFYLQTTEVGILSLCDRFWRRILQTDMVWRALHCRDYGCAVASCGRCTWQALNGRGADTEQCLFHLARAPEAGASMQGFRATCKQLTRIPGRAKEELLETYKQWYSKSKEREATAEDAAVPALLPSVAAAEAKEDAAAAAIDTGVAVAGKPPEPPLPWRLRAHSSYGLSLQHTRSWSLGPAGRTGPPPPRPPVGLLAKTAERTFVGRPPPRARPSPRAV